MQHGWLWTTYWSWGLSGVSVPVHTILGSTLRLGKRSANDSYHHMPSAGGDL
ncbi:hypothetical protein PISMIDRAFT_672116 [Pisolithus microcarpus 441]|uniref:Uncharacterized protein n=1 Tax=Pisolithus microcarpus 441 TaxID=765257 RepID=A0A0D0A4X2_9AGAM|nr:hypothetical protein BKA83DRAFT_672116 [Pisolithus microcarpus]KIK29427.1 hypothetical protein PISMIDRAFT_672116 [Pisolithus microcarpus 441]